MNRQCQSVKRTNAIKMRAIVVLYIMCALAISCQSHDLIVGHATTRDDAVLVFTAREKQLGSPSVVRTSIIEYPGIPAGIKANITAIYVQDNRCIRAEGYPSIIEGGLGHNFVKIKLESRVDDCFDFSIRIYGRI